MAAPGVNWHQVVGNTAATLGNGLVLSRSTVYNILWLGAGGSNSGTVALGFNSTLTFPANGTASNTDGWPLAQGKTLPLLVGENFDAGANFYAIANTNAQDLFVIGF